LCITNVDIIIVIIIISSTAVKFVDINLDSVDFIAVSLHCLLVDSALDFIVGWESDEGHPHCK